MDPFHHHPALRDEIRSPEESFFYSMTAATFLEVLKAKGSKPLEIHSDLVREGMRQRLLAQRPGPDIWVFAYGSLMWDPGFHFAEVRRARVEGYARKFVLKDEFGGRGSEEAPGLMAGLAPGGGCDGLAYRIAPDAVEPETARVCRRELLGPAYRPAWHVAETAQGPVDVILFVADPEAEGIALDLPYETQVAYLATGTGFLGSSYDYLRELVLKLRHFSIRDAELETLLADVETARGAL